MLILFACIVDFEIRALRKCSLLSRKTRIAACGFCSVFLTFLRVACCKYNFECLPLISLCIISLEKLFGCVFHFSGYVYFVLDEPVFGYLLLLLLA